MYRCAMLLKQISPFRFAPVEMTIECTVWSWMSGSLALTVDKWYYGRCWVIGGVRLAGVRGEGMGGGYCGCL